MPCAILAAGGIKNDCRGLVPRLVVRFMPFEGERNEKMSTRKQKERLINEHMIDERSRKRRPYKRCKQTRSNWLGKHELRIAAIYRHLPIEHIEEIDNLMRENLCSKHMKTFYELAEEYIIAHGGKV
jgi:hypothetical protein